LPNSDPLLFDNPKPVFDPENNPDDDEVPTFRPEEKGEVVL